MKITWLGHASFLLEDNKGRKVLTDPFDESVGYNIFTDTANVVTISHHHFDHDYTKKIKNAPEIIDKVGFFHKCDIPISGYPSFHDKVNGEKRGENIIYIIEMDGYRICHLGDLGHILSHDDISRLGRIDILLIPVGGNFTIDASEASKVAKDIKSHLIIPMHYKTPEVNFPIDGVEPFIIKMKNGEKINSNTIHIDGELTDYNTVKILDYK